MTAPFSKVNSKTTGVDIALTFSRQFLAGLMQLGVVMIVARALGAEGVGAYSVALLLPTLLSQLFNMGITSANVYFVASGQFDAKTVWVVSRDVGTGLGLLGLALAVGVVLVAGENLFPGVPASALLIAALAFPVLLISGLVVSLFQAWQDFRSFNLLVLVQPIVLFVGTAALLLLSSFQLNHVLLLTVFSHICVLVLGLIRLRRYIPLISFRVSRTPYIRAALGYGIKTHAYNLVSFLNYRLDVFLVNLLVGPTSAGIYSTAVRIVEQLWMVSHAVSTVLIPRLSSMVGDESGRSVLATRVGRVVFWITLLGAALLGLLSGPLVYALFGPGFEKAVLTILILLPGVILFSVARVLANDLAARGFVGLNLLVATGVFTLNGLGNLVFIPIYGVYGAALATSLAYILSLLVRLVLLPYWSGVVWWKLFVPQVEDRKFLRMVMRRLKVF